MSIFHKRHRAPYHTENSLRGIRTAARATKRVARRIGNRIVRQRVKRWNEIDLDVNMTSDGVIVNTHWGMPLLKDGFIDPKGEIPKHAHVRDLTWAQISRLHTKDGYHIRTLERAITECAAFGIGARVEPKVDVRFEDVAVWLPIKAHADKVGCRIKGYSIRNLGGKGAGVRRVEAMRAAGIPAVPIH